MCVGDVYFIIPIHQYGNRIDLCHVCLQLCRPNLTVLSWTVAVVVFVDKNKGIYVILLMEIGHIFSVLCV